MQRFYTHKTRNSGPRDEPWITNEVRHKFKKHNYPYKKWKRTPTGANFDNYTQVHKNTEEVKKHALLFL